MKINKLNLRNFKGLKTFTLDAGGQNISIFGDNATGKTTVYDAFHWLLFDKDSQNKKDFEIKTIGADGRHIHGLDHSVEAELEVGTRSLTLKKVYKEKWTKKRGSARADFTGHTTDYFIDDVPVKKSEYESRIGNIADENVFKLLTSPAYFNEKLHWQERRKILLQVCGDISNEEVIASDNALAELPGILKDYAIDDYRKILAARRSEINKELDRIPVRIDEVQLGLPDISDIDASQSDSHISFIKNKIRTEEQRLARVESGGESAEKTKSLRELEGQLLEIRSRYHDQHEKLLREKQDQYSQARMEHLELTNQIAGEQDRFKLYQGEIVSLEKKMAELREQWHDVNHSQFESKDNNCPTCGQTMPGEGQALAIFNKSKSDRLEEIQLTGKARKGQVEKLKSQQELTQKNLGKNQLVLEEAAQKMESLSKEITEINKAMTEYSKDPAYVKTQKEIKELEEAVADLQAGNLDETGEIKARIAELQAELLTAEDQLNGVRRHKQGQERIQELKGQERMLAEEYEKLEQELYLAEQFIKTKVLLLEEKINSCFAHARFKLFDVQVNGGVAETCQTLLNGVPFPDINSAGKIQVGLDIISTLQDYYNFRAPVVIDNRESVVRLPEMKCQVISLVASGKHKKLHVEAGGQKSQIKEAI